MSEKSVITNLIDEEGSEVPSLVVSEGVKHPLVDIRFGRTASTEATNRETGLLPPGEFYQGKEGDKGERQLLKVFGGLIVKTNFIPTEYDRKTIFSAFEEEFEHKPPPHGITILEDYPGIALNRKWKPEDINAKIKAQGGKIQEEDLHRTVNRDVNSNFLIRSGSKDTEKTRAFARETEFKAIERLRDTYDLDISKRQELNEVEKNSLQLNKSVSHLLETHKEGKSEHLLPRSFKMSLNDQKNNRVELAIYDSRYQYTNMGGEILIEIDKGSNHPNILSVRLQIGDQSHEIPKENWGMALGYVRPEVKQQEINREITTISDKKEHDPRLRVTRAIRELRKKRPRETEGSEFNIFPSIGVVGDSDKIENQQIDLIEQRNSMVASFKMTEQHLKQVTDKLSQQISSDNGKVKKGTYGFVPADEHHPTQNMTEAFYVWVDNHTRIYVSTGQTAPTEHKEVNYNKPIKNRNGEIVDFETDTNTIRGNTIGSLIGAVQIRIQGVNDEQEIADKLNLAFSEIGIKEALVTPGQEAERKYKEARYRWQHKIEDDNEWDEWKVAYKQQHRIGILEHLTREEVFPGYHTIVDRGASNEYQKDENFLLIHRVSNPDNLNNIIKTGLLSSHERYKRGIITNGMSTAADFTSGGADNVFIRAIPESAQHILDNMLDYESVVTLLIKPDILDRTDWYAYPFDLYGTTDPTTFNSRLSPRKFFDEQRTYPTTNNEIMMRRGIPPTMLEAIVVGSPNVKEQLILNTQQAGIQEVNGIPIYEFIKVYGET